MADVGFYHLTRWPLERALPKLLETVRARGHYVVILAGSEERVHDLNQHLWTYQERSWLPHGAAEDGNAEKQPIFLTSEEVNPAGADVLVLIDGVNPSYYGSFARVLDMLDGRDDDAVQAGRQRWRNYKAAGHQVTYWRQGEAGGWEKQGG